MNRNDFDVPPVFDVPADVRARIEARVLPNLSDDEPQRQRPKGAWLAIAAAVAVFVAGGLVMLVSRPNNLATTAAPTVYTLAEATPLERCWQSAKRSPTPYPDPSAWQEVMAVQSLQSTILALRANGKPVFCETTPFRVSLSTLDADLDYAEGTKTAALLRTDTGTVAGVVDPSWSKVMVEVFAPNGDGYSAGARVTDGLFVMATPMSKLDKISVRPADEGPWLTLPEPHPAFSTVEPQHPSGDRTTPLGKQLGECLAKSGKGADETASWNPGAVVGSGGVTVIMTVNPGGVGACYEQRERTQFLPYLTRTADTDKPKLLPVMPAVGELPLMAGQAPAAATLMRVTFTDNTILDVPITAGTFAALPSPTAGPPVSCVLLDQNNREIYTGPFGA